MVVLATNRPSDLDAAVLDRVDEALEFPLPGAAERRELLNLYVAQYILGQGAGYGGASGPSAGTFTRLVRGRKLVADPIAVAEDVTSELWDEVAGATDDMSAREMAKLVAAMAAASYGTKERRLTAELVLSVLRRKVAEHQKRRTFESTSVSYV